MPPPTTSPAPLSRERIAEAALQVVDREQLEGLSVRRVARELGRAPMSLYRHVDGYEDLLAMVVDRLTADLGIEDRGADWRRTLREAAHRLRTLIGRHPGIIAAVMASGIRTDGMLGVLDVVMGALRRAGLTADQAVRAHQALFTTVFGDSVVQHAARELFAAGGEDPDDPASRLRFADEMVRAGGERYPDIAAVAGAWATVDPDDAFSFAMDLLLDGIAALGDG